MKDLTDKVDFEFDVMEHSAAVFYSGFGGGGFGGGSGSGFGGGGFKPSSSLGSSGRSDFGRHCDMGHMDSSYSESLHSDPCGPLARENEIQIKPIELPDIKIEPLDIKPLELNLGIASPPSSLGSAGRKKETNPLLEVVTRGHYNPPSGLGSAGRDSWKIEDFNYRGQGLGIGTEIINVDREHKVAIKLYEDLDNRETRLTFEPFGRHHRNKVTLLKMPWEKDD